MQPFNVAILGATGLVGQQLLRLLDGHPWFRVGGLAASERSVGRSYGQGVQWRQPGDVPEAVRQLPVLECAVDALDHCDLVFSALGSAAGREIEPRFRDAGFAVISNSSAYRQHPDVPLVIPEVNPQHLDLIDSAGRQPGGGYIVTNPNCSVSGLALALAPLQQAFGIRRAVVVTLQAVSGAGADGPLALDMLDNVIPHISGEEPKMESELARIYGRLRDGTVQPAALTVSAHCHRVGTVDAHLEAVSLELERNASLDDVLATLREYRGAIAELDLPTAPARPLRLLDAPDRPQPRLDRDRGNGMTVSVGRVRSCPVLGLKLELLSHNTIRGAAGGALLNAELLAARRRLPRRGAR